MSTHPARSYAADWMLDAWSSRADQRAHLFPSFNVTDEEFHISACGRVRAAAFIPAQWGTPAYCKACARHEPTPPAEVAPHEKNARGLAERAAATAQRNARLAKAKALAAKAKALAAKAKARAEKQAAQAKLAQEIKAARGQEAIDEEPHECTASDMKGVGPEDLAWMAYWSQPKTQRLAMTAP